MTKESALTVIHDGISILAFKRRDGNIGLPCGKVDEGETIPEAASRELFEETGMKLDWKDLELKGSGRPHPESLVHYFVYKVSSLEDFEFNTSEGFENEGRPFVCSLVAFVEQESTFKEFNRKVLLDCGVIDKIFLGVVDNMKRVDVWKTVRLIRNLKEKMKKD